MTLMTSRLIRSSTHLKLFLLFTLILVVSLVAHHLPLAFRLTFNSTHPDSNPPPILRIEGRWKSVRASLGLPPLSDRVRLRVPSAQVSSARNSSRPLSRIASRFDLRRRRSLEEQESQVVNPLFFAPDSSEQRSISLDDFLGSFRSAPLDRPEITNWKAEGPWGASVTRGDQPASGGTT